MQNRDGGWGAFDRNNNREFLCHVPFADHNAMIDPSTPDLTGRVLEALGQLGRRLGDPAVDRAVAYLRAAQKADGSWFGRWGVNYIYGTWQALTGLAAVGVPADDPAMVGGRELAAGPPTGRRRLGRIGRQLRDPAPPRPRAADRLADGLGLDGAAGGRAWPTIRPSPAASDTCSTRKTRTAPGTRREFTGTGFPRVFYLRYHYYPIYFPLLALSQWAVKAGRAAECETATSKAGARVQRLTVGGFASFRTRTAWSTTLRDSFTTELQFSAPSRHLDSPCDSLSP